MDDNPQPAPETPDDHDQPNPEPPERRTGRTSAPTACSSPSASSPAPQSAEIDLADGRTVLNFCANNYLGLADHPRRHRRPPRTRWTATASAWPRVRFICGTQDLHKQLEAEDRRLLRHRGHHPLRRLLRRQRRPVRAAARRAGRGHLRRAQPRLDHRRRAPVQGQALPLRQLRHGRPGSSSCKQAAADGARDILITTDGVFSMDGIIAPLDQHHRAGARIRRAGAHRRMPRDRLPRRHRPRLGRGERRAGPDRHLHRHARQGAGRRARRLHHRHARSDRPAAPALAPLPVLQLAAAARGRRRHQGLRHAGRRRRPARDSWPRTPRYFREQHDRRRLRPQARASTRSCRSCCTTRRWPRSSPRDLLEEGIYAIGFFFPVVAKGQARIRTQISAAHTREHLDRAIAAFTKVGKKLGVV